ncbi:MAG: hypothetical protein FJ029_12820 [Actinobacteria bacterium]|nr:hypothetical protein [Actinomycetota bacterium]
MTASAEGGTPKEPIVDLAELFARAGATVLKHVLRAATNYRLRTDMSALEDCAIKAMLGPPAPCEAPCCTA